MKRLIFFAKHMELGGIEKSLLNLLNRLDFNEYQVELVLEEKHGPLLEQLDPRVSVSEYPVSDCKLVPLRKALNLTRRMLWKQKHQGKYDFACAYCTYSIPGSRLAQYASPNNCLYVHNDYTTIYPELPDFQLFFDQLHTQNFRKIVFVSNENKDGFTQRMPKLADRCTVINNIVEWERIIKLAQEPCELQKAPGETMFMFVGRLDETQKRLSRMLKAFQIARETRKDIRLLIVGDGPERALYEQLIEEYALQDCVTMVGAQLNPYKYLHAADCLVLSSDYEGFPVVYFEAMILGKDIITTFPVSDERIDVGAYATVAEKTPESFAQALIAYTPRENTPLDMGALNQMRMEALYQIINGN